MADAIFSISVIIQSFLVPLLAIGLAFSALSQRLLLRMLLIQQMELDLIKRHVGLVDARRPRA